MLDVRHVFVILTHDGLVSYYVGEFGGRAGVLCLQVLQSRISLKLFIDKPQDNKGRIVEKHLSVWCDLGHSTLLLATLHMWGK